MFLPLFTPLVALCVGSVSALAPSTTITATVQTSPLNSDVNEYVVAVLATGSQGTKTLSSWSTTELPSSWPSIAIQVRTDYGSTYTDGTVTLRSYNITVKAQAYELIYYKSTSSIRYGLRPSSTVFTSTMDYSLSALTILANPPTMTVEVAVAASTTFTWAGAAGTAAAAPTVVKGQIRDRTHFATCIEPLEEKYKSWTTSGSWTLAEICVGSPTVPNAAPTLTTKFQYIAIELTTITPSPRMAQPCTVSMQGRAFDLFSHQFTKYPGQSESYTTNLTTISYASISTSFVWTTPCTSHGGWDFGPTPQPIWMTPYTLTVGVGPTQTFTWIGGTNSENPTGTLQGLGTTAYRCEQKNNYKSLYGFDQSATMVASCYWWTRNGGNPPAPFTTANFNTANPP